MIDFSGNASSANVVWNSASCKGLVLWQLLVWLGITYAILVYKNVFLTIRFNLLLTRACIYSWCQFYNSYRVFDRPFVVIFEENQTKDSEQWKIKRWSVWNLDLAPVCSGYVCVCVYTGLSVRSSVWHCAIWLLAPVQSAPIPLRKVPLLNIHNYFLSILLEARLLK